ncbi:MAG: ribosome small subunit-dependent GTPase A [Burkholderiaceae bacterium]|nr:ribosome small subunit-dependent GTPase A [Gemmatimonadales bacterium]MCO5121208.1 ribosome small subunit-dependent GTPase A [Burkholderiaceae bacterium]
MASTAAGPEAALVVASYGRRYLLRFEADGAERPAVSRGKRTEACVGDLVTAMRLGADQAVIERIEPRRNLLLRSDRHRSKALAANVDRAAVVIAGDPHYAEELLLRLMLAIDAAGIALLVIANKTDLVQAHRRIGPRLELLRSFGHPVVEVAARSAPAEAVAALRPWLAGSITLLLGESGMGKSSLVNALAPHAEQATRSISTALGTGRHTTTFSRLFDLDPAIAPDARIIDSPGFQTFGLAHLSASQRVHAMAEFGPLIGKCRFHSCTHRHEPGCAIRAAVEAGEIDALRYRLFTELHERD